MDWIEQRGDGVRIRVRVQPRASRTEIAGVQEGVLRVRVTAPPVEGEANEALVRLIAKRLRVAASRISVVSGSAARTKVLEIEGVSAAEVAGSLQP